MKVLLSSIGSRGDVQPLLAIALELRALGHEARLCVAPNFKDWVESHGLACTPIGPDLERLTGGTAPARPSVPSAEQRRQLAAHTVRSQFPVLTEAARGCDLLVGAGVLQFATRSIAEWLGLPYVFAAYCPVALPSSEHPPPKLGMHYSQSLSALENLSFWREEEQSWNDLFREALNEERTKIGLAPIDSVLPHILTHRPWLAADPLLAPAGSTADLRIVQSGAWLLPDQGRLPAQIEHFLANGEPPVYFGFGSMRAAGQMSRVLIETARALGLRSIIAQGWANLAPIDAGVDCLSVGEVAHERLFPRVAAVVHHGGAGTTTAAARAGRGQVIVPCLYDQYYWAHRVQRIGIGVCGPTREDLSEDTLIPALQECLRPGIALQAQRLAPDIEPQGAQIAARQLIEDFG